MARLLNSIAEQVKKCPSGALSYDLLKDAK